jgi:integrase
MSYHEKNTASSMTGPTFADVLAWAEAGGEKYEAIRELRKVPARLGLHDDDLGLISADLGHFERRIAPSSYAAVSRASDIGEARDRGNSRLRALLTRFHAAGRPTVVNSNQRADWGALIRWIAERTAPGGRSRFANGAEMSLYLLQARAGCGPRDLSQDDVERIAREVDSGRRDTLRNAIRLLERLREERVNEIAHLLPEAPLAVPVGVARLRKLDWSAFPASFCASVERTLDAAISTVDCQADEIIERLLAGENVEDLREEFNKRTGRPIGNSAASRKGLREAIAWLVHAFLADGGRTEDLTGVRDVFDIRRVQGACAWQVERIRASPFLLDPDKSQTLHSRLTNLRILATRGLADDRLKFAIDMAFKKHAKNMRKPGDDLAVEIAAFCRLIQSSPHVARMIVQAPAELASRASDLIEKAGGHRARELTALRMYGAAAIAAIQMSRPLRTRNARYCRVVHSGALAANLRRTPEGYEARFPRGEIKNEKAVAFDVVGEDALILRRWIVELRPRYMQLHKLDASPYLIPGDAVPTLEKDGSTLPPGCMSSGSFDILWKHGMAELGLDMTVHMCRHAVAILVLALRPGDYALAASVLGDTEETVEKHYGQDDGQAAALFVRDALLAAHPLLLKKLDRRYA